MVERRYPEECEYCGKWKSNPMHRYAYCYRKCLEWVATDIAVENSMEMEKLKNKNNLCVNKQAPLFEN